MIMSQVKIFTAETASELEMKINEWLRLTKPSDVSFCFTADGVETPYSVMVWYRISKL